MAITGTFIADFASFQSAVQKAEVSLKGFEGSANKVGTALDRATDSFSGVKIVQQATIAAEAVERIGGVSKLTESELARVSATASEAAAKLRAMGQDVPPGIQRIADASKQAHGETTSWTGSLGKLASTFGIAFSVGAVLNFGKRVLDAAGQVNDLSTQLGISTDAVQGFKFAAEQSGSTLDAVGTAITKMNVNLAGGEKSTVQALRAAGLQFSDIRAMRPEDGFLAITDAIAKIEDPALRAEIAVKLFGRTGAELLPAIQEGFRKTADSASKMSDETIKRLDAAGDAWARLADSAVIYSGEMIAATQRVIEHGTKSWGNFFKLLASGLPGGAGAQFATSFAFDEIAASSQKAGKEVENAAPKFAHTRAEMDAATRASNAYAKELQSIIDKISGADLAREVQKLAEAYNSPHWVSSAESLKRVGLMAEELRKRGATLTPQLRELANATIDVSKALPPVVSGWEGVIGTQHDVADSARQLGVVIAGAANPILALLPISEQSFGVMATKVTKVKTTTEELHEALGALSGSLANLAQVAGGSLGAIAGGMSTIIGSIDTARKAVDTFKSGFGAKDTLAGISNMASGIMGIVSAAIAAGKAVKAIWDAFDRNKGRDLVKDFAESFGGFDQLHKELQTLGAAGEELWIKLTQGVGRNNPDQAQRVIAEVEAALAKQKAAQEAATVSTEEGAQATIETATQAAKALDELNGRLQGNRDEWRAWSADVTGFLQKLAADIRAMPLPGPTGVVSGTGTIAGASATLRGTQPSAASAGYAPINVNIDGEAAWSGLVRVAQQRDVA